VPTSSTPPLLVVDFYTNSRKNHAEKRAIFAFLHILWLFACIGDAIFPHFPTGSAIFSFHFGIKPRQNRSITILIGTQKCLREWVHNE
jgi:hypothetical protein